MADYNFVRFTSRGSKKGSYQISLNKSLFFGLLSGFYSKEGIKDFKKAILFYDKSRKAIAIIFTNDKNAEGAFSVTHNKNNNNSGSIAARSFFIKNEIAQDQFFGRKIPRKERDDKLGMLYVIDLVDKE